MERTNYPANTEAKHNLHDSGLSSSDQMTEKHDEHHDKSMGEKMKDAISNLIPGSHKKDESQEKGHKDKGPPITDVPTSATELQQHTLQHQPAKERMEERLKETGKNPLVTTTTTTTISNTVNVTSTATSNPFTETYTTTTTVKKT